MGILDEIGITINLTDTPEYKAYAEYYLNRNRLVQWFLRTFKWAEIARLSFQVQCKELNMIMEAGHEVFMWEAE